MKGVLKFLIKLQADSSSLMEGARRVSRELETISSRARRVGASLRQAFSPSALGASLMSIPGMQFLLNPYTMIASGLGAITKLGAEAEMTATAFTTLVGNEEKARSTLEEIARFASESPFGKMELTASAQQMLSFGISTDKAMTYLRQLGDISGGSKEKLSSLSLVMSQVSAAGKLMGQDLLQFINAGFNPLKELQKMHPEKSYEDLQEAMSKGAISAEMVASAIAHATGEGGQFHGMLEKTSQTIEGRWSTLMDSLSEMAIELFEAIKPYVSSLIDLLQKLIPYISRAFRVLFSAIVGVLQFVDKWRAEMMLLGSIIGIVYLAIQAKTIALGAYASIMGVVSLATKLWTGAQWLLNIALSANPIGLVIVGISALVAVVIYCWNKFAGFRAFLITAWDTFKQLGSVIKDYVVNRIHEMLEGLGKVGKALKLLLSGDFSEAWSTFKDGVKGIHGVESRKKAIGATKEVVQGIGGAWQKNYSTEQAKDKEGKAQKGVNAIGTPSLKGSQSLGELDLSGGKAGKKGKGKAGKTASAIATGGSRPTTINISITKLIETLSVQMMDKADTHELERVVLQALNRSLAIATSTE